MSDGLNDSRICGASVDKGVVSTNHQNCAECNALAKNLAAAHGIDTAGDEGNERQTFKVYLPKDVHGDWPFSQVVATAGEHAASANQHGAVFVILADGSLLGVKPGEFRRVQ